MTVLALLVVACAPNDPPQHTANPQDTGSEDHGLFEPVALAAEADRQRHGATGLAVAVFNSDGVVWSFGTGSRRVNEQVPVTADTRFRFASILKMMTATAVLQQHERGNLDIHGPVWDVLPEFRVEGFIAESAGLSIIDLTTHRSGLSEHYELTRGPSDEALAEGVDWLTTHGYFMAPPDSFFNYNNMNYALAGRLIEVADGRSYRSVMQDDVFEPLGMTRTLFLGQTVMDQDDDWAEALGTDWTGFSSNEVVIRPNSYDSGFICPAGLAFSTVTDLSAFGSFLLAGNPSVLGEAEHSRLTTPTGAIGERPHEQYAHGLLVWDELVLGDVAYPTPVLGHSGDFPGFTSNLLVLPELDWGVVVLASGEQAHADATKAAALPPSRRAPQAPIPHEPTHRLAGEERAPGPAAKSGEPVPTTNQVVPVRPISTTLARPNG